ncbi:MAG TPA: SDR family oxidoreductase [Chitinophagaceae bacterium]|nr:SDR family oxidoreductase [Chitinophagaceae bacterium]
MNILVTGANGFLGQHLLKYFSAGEWNITGASRGKRRVPEDITSGYMAADLTDKEAVEAIVKTVQPQVIIHAAAISKPDDCENNKSYCLQNNVEATSHLLQAFKLVQTPAPLFIYLSTDFVFGDNGPHGEDDVKEPLNFYGQSKLMAEELVINCGLPCAIVRPVFIYGDVWDGVRPSFLHWVKNSLEAHRTIKVVSDQLRTPTYAYDICSGINAIIKQQKTGVYHLAGKDVISPYTMAVTTARVLGLEEGLVENVTSETFPEPVKRAKRSGLKIDKAVHELEYAPVSFEEGVRRTFRLQMEDVADGRF